MADIKWSAFPNGGSIQSGDIIVGLRSGSNYQFNTSGSIITWAVNNNASISAAVNNGYILTHGGATTMTLPTTFAVGSIIGIIGTSSAWTLNIGAGTNVIAFGNTYTTSFASTNNTDSLILLATVANATWQITGMSSTGLTAS